MQEEKNCEIIKMTPPANFSFYMLRKEEKKNVEKSWRQSKPRELWIQIFNAIKKYESNKFSPKKVFCFLKISKEANKLKMKLVTNGSS